MTHLERNFLVNPTMWPDPEAREGTTEHRYGIQVDTPNLFMYASQSVWTNGLTETSMKVVDLSQEILLDPVDLFLKFNQSRFLELCSSRLTFRTWAIHEVSQHLHIKIEVYDGDYAPLIIARVSCYDEVPAIPWLGPDITDDTTYGLHQLLRDGLPPHFKTWQQGHMEPA